MRVFKKKPISKSWELVLRQSLPNVAVLGAVDSHTALRVCDLIVFEEDGKVLTSTNAKQKLEMEGYDPFEHGNQFDDQGRLLIK
jgi:hypothetical protein